MKGLPAVLPDWHVTLTISGCADTVTVAVPEAVAPFASCTLNLSVKLPLTGWVTLKVPVPEYGPVPPVAETVQLKGLPAVTPDAGHVTVTTSGWAVMVTVVDPLAEIPLESFTVNLSVKVPLTGWVTVKVPVPV